MASNTSNGCPYKGLQPYSEEDREYFFGRERDTEVIASNLYIAPLTILYGTSGVGKSSVLQAGVISQLREDRRVIVLLFNNWQGENFLAALKETVLHAICGSTEKTPDEVLRQVNEKLETKELVGLERLPLDEFVTACAVIFRRRLLIIFDQFEEYFLYHTATKGSEGFDAEFARAVNHPESGVNFMISMREEELSKLDRFRPRIANLLNNLLRLENLDSEAANNAITKPLGVYNEHYPADRMTIEENLIAAIIEQVRPNYVRQAATGAALTSSETSRASVDRIETPFLQLVLTRLWEAERRNRSHVLRWETFNELGGALEIARTHLDKVMDQVTESQRATAAAVLRFLVTPTGSKIALDAASLASFANEKEKDVLEVLDLLGSGKEMRILRKVTTRHQPDRYELFHDVLGPAILDWRARYVQAQQLNEQRAEAERAFTIERQKRLRQAVGVMVVLLIVMAFLTVFAFTQRAQALEQRQFAIVALTQATEAREDLEEEKKRVELAKAESDRQRTIAVAAKLDSDEQRAIAIDSEREALRLKELEAGARQKAESETRRANEQATLAQNLVAISEFNLKGFDAARLGDTDDSIRNFQHALNLSQLLENAPGESYALINIADGYGSRGEVIPLELFTQFDNYEGSKYDDFLDDNYQVESYGSTLQKKLADPQQKEALLKDQAAAITAYEAALDANRRQTPPDPKREAWIQQRIGDVRMSSAMAELVQLNRFEPDFSAAIKSYNEASDAYQRAGLPLEEGNMQTRIALLLRSGSEENPNQLAGAKSAYQRARRAFQSAGATSREAATLIRLGETYKEFKPSTAEYQKEAVDYYSQGAELYGDMGIHQQEGENYFISAELSAQLPLLDKDRTAEFKQRAFDNYAKAIEAFQAAERKLPAVETKFNATEKQSGPSDKGPTPGNLLSNRLKAAIKAIGNLYALDPKPQPDLKQYFERVVAKAGDNSARASMLHAIGDLFNSDLKDKPSAIVYYRAEYQARKEAGNPIAQAGILVTIGNAFDDLPDRTNAKASFEEARAIYRELSGNPNTARDQVIPDLISIAKTYSEWGETRLAFNTYDQAFSLFEAQDRSSGTYRLDEIISSALKLLPETEAPRFIERLTTFYKNRSDNPNQASVLERAAELYVIWGKPREALNYYNRALALRPPPFTSLGKIGKLFFDLRDEAGATTFFQNVIESYRSRKDLYTEPYALSHIAAFYRDSGKTTAAINYYADSVAAFCRQKNPPGQAASLRALSRILQNLGDSEEATRLNGLADNPNEVSNCDFQIKRRSQPR